MFLHGVLIASLWIDQYSDTWRVSWILYYRRYFSYVVWLVRPVLPGVIIDHLWVLLVFVAGQAGSHLSVIVSMGTPLVPYRRASERFMAELESHLISLNSCFDGTSRCSWSFRRETLKWSFSKNNIWNDVRFLQKKVHSLSIAPESLAYLARKSLRVLNCWKSWKILSDSMYLIARVCVRVLLFLEKVLVHRVVCWGTLRYFLGRWPLAVMIAGLVTGHTLLGISFRICCPTVASRVLIFSGFCLYCFCTCQTVSILWTWSMHSAWLPINTLLVSVEISKLQCCPFESLVAMDMLVCEVDQPRGMCCVVLFAVVGRNLVIEIKCRLVYQRYYAE